MIAFKTVLSSAVCSQPPKHPNGADRFITEPDRWLCFTGGFPDADSVLRWGLTFGGKAELLEQPVKKRRKRPFLIVRPEFALTAMRAKPNALFLPLLGDVFDWA